MAQTLLLPASRHAIKTAIDRLITILDGLDAAGEDLEDGHDLELEDEHGTEIDRGEADESDYALEGAFFVGGIA